MSELVVVRQKSDYTTSFLAADPEAGEPGKPEPVAHLHELTPYGMMLASLGTCTAILLNSYAQNRALPLDEVELTLGYHRDHKKDCERCEESAAWDEGISVELRLTGKLPPEVKEKLLAVSRRCPVEKILEHGISVSTVLVEAPAGGTP